ncbi:acylphosphatase [Devosia ginsengisoli]|uniref:Acylphosphatase n=1 Tax=Devosia ginsengisoli TaxID=400770 RepID=A0A5B8LTH7_9HYPH|nr:acylphosphatase [Devosia ginsengisoli]QDZ11568.1 acylphosphatase [Devosia ginsengisoli]
MRSAHVIITGRVQGVGFRVWVEAEAVARGLGGWVRNRRDGTVEAVFRGQASDVGGMLDVCWNGPDMALVNHVAVSETDERPAGFEIRATV